MIVLDLFSGTGSSTQAFADRGHLVVRVELDPRHEAEMHANVMDLTPESVVALCGGVPDFIWASPPCTAFSVASIGTHWTGGRRAYEPRTQSARDSMALVAHTVALIQALNPSRGWLMENPRGVLRKLAPVQGLARRTVTYCAYGDERMKPTDLWGNLPGWTPRPMCKNGSPCHVAAPRGAKTGTQGRKGAVDRSRVPYALSLEVCIAAERAALASPASGEPVTRADAPHPVTVPQSDYPLMSRCAVCGHVGVASTHPCKDGHYAAPSRDAARGEDAEDLRRFRWLARTLEGAVGGGVEVNDERLVYERPEPGKEVRVYWYPNTPVGFNDAHGSTLREAIDDAMAGDVGATPPSAPGESGGTEP